MSRIIKCGLIQAHNVASADAPIDEIKKANLDHQMKLVEDAAKQGVQMLCFQEIFTTPYFCAEQQTRWYEAVEKIPDGTTVKLMQEVAKQRGMVLVVPIYEEEQTGIYYNSAAVIDADGKYLGKYRKTHIPHVAPGFWGLYALSNGSTIFVAPEASGGLWSAASDMTFVDDILKAVEAAFVGTTLGVLPVTSVEKRPVGSGRPGPVAAFLHQRLMEKMDNDPSIRTPF